MLLCFTVLLLKNPGFLQYGHVLVLAKAEKKINRVNFAVAKRERGWDLQVILCLILGDKGKGLPFWKEELSCHYGGMAGITGFAVSILAWITLLHAVVC